MKQILFFLLLANGIFFLWEKYVQPGMDAIPARAESGRKLDKIVLIKELPPVPLVQVEPSPPAPDGKHGAGGALPAPATSGEPVAPASTPSIPPVAEVAAKPVSPAPAAPSPQPSPLPKAKQATGPAEAPAKIAAGAAPEAATLVPQRQSAASSQPAAPPRVKAEPAAVPQSPAKSVRTQCRRIGPLASETDAQALRQRLAVAASEAGIEHKSSKEEIGYWVLYPPAADLQGAKANKALLQQKGALDTLIIKEGDNALAVSVGFFKDRLRAEKALAEARAKGMQLEIRPRLAPRDEYWLTWRAEPSAAVEARWSAWRSEHADAAAGISSCP